MIYVLWIKLQITKNAIVIKINKFLIWNIMTIIGEWFW